MPEYNILGYFKIWQTTANHEYVYHEYVSKSTWGCSLAISICFCLSSFQTKFLTFLYSRKTFSARVAIIFFVCAVCVTN